MKAEACTFLTRKQKTKQKNTKIKADTLGSLLSESPPRRVLGCGEA